METPEHIRRNRLVGGNPALDFLNTHGQEAGDEALRGYEDLVAWAQYVGTLTDDEARALVDRATADPAAARAAYERALPLREALDVSVGAIVAGREPSRAALGALGVAEADALAHGELVGSNGGFTWSWARDDDLSRPVRPIVHAAIALLTRGPLDRVKRCGGCSFVFVDESKNRSRHWCSMDDCGTAEKMRRYVARRAAARPSRVKGPDTGGAQGQ